jgi:hypothetical protein
MLQRFKQLSMLHTKESTKSILKAKFSVGTSLTGQPQCKSAYWRSKTDIDPTVP